MWEARGSIRELEHICLRLHVNSAERQVMRDMCNLLPKQI